MFPGALELNNSNDPNVKKTEIKAIIARQVGQKYCPSNVGVEKHPSHFGIQPKYQHDYCMIVFFKNAEMFFQQG